MRLAKEVAVEPKLVELRVCVILPNDGSLIFRVGKAKCGGFDRLNTSVGKWGRSLSVKVKDFSAPMSKFTYRGPRMILRPALPGRSPLASWFTTKAVVSNQ